MKLTNNFQAVKEAIAARRNMLGDTVWNHIGQERRNWITVEECAKSGVNVSMYAKWSATNK